MDDEDYNSDEVDEDFDSDFDSEDELDDELEPDVGGGRDLSELEELGAMDGQQDAISGSFYTGFGMSVSDLDELSDEERDAYEAGYHTGFGAGGGWNG